MGLYAKVRPCEGSMRLTAFRSNVTKANPTEYSFECEDKQNKAGGGTNDHNKNLMDKCGGAGLSLGLGRM